MKIFKACLIFGAGALAGAFVAARTVKERYQQEAEEEIAEMREYYRKAKKEATKVEPKEEVKEEKEDFKPIEEVAKAEGIIKEKGYINYTSYNDTEPIEDKKEETRTDYEPFIIDVEEYGEDPNYDTATVTYYKDKVLADDVDEPIDYSVVGEENLKIFDENPDVTAIYVRDDIYMVDYEVLRDPCSFDEYDNYDKPPHVL